MDTVSAPLAVPPELGIPDILHAVLDPLVGKDTPRAQGETFDASEDSRESSMGPFGHLSQPLLPRSHAERQAGAGNDNDNEGAQGGSEWGGNTPCQCPP